MKKEKREELCVVVANCIIKLSIIAKEISKSKLIGMYLANRKSAQM